MNYREITFSDGSTGFIKDDPGRVEITFNDHKGEVKIKQITAEQHAMKLDALSVTKPVKLDVSVLPTDPKAL
jgi:hypothetical protein